jgi:type I restriction-modification system DNA methylase subunit
MDISQSQIVSFIWDIADDCLRDVFVRGQHRDVILPMVVLRRYDASLETTKDAVEEDIKAQKQLESKYRGEVTPVPLLSIVKAKGKYGGGALNCISWNINQV